MALVLTLLALCCQDNDTGRSMPPALAIPTVSSDEIIERCSPWLLDTEYSEESLEHNELVNLIIDQAWDLQMAGGGIFYHIMTPGVGNKAAWGDQVLVEYIGYDTSGRIFDSSLYRKHPFKFYVGNVIEGWNEALSMLAVQGRGIFVIPAYKAYGKEGFGNMVGPDEHLIFQIELIGILP